MESSAGNGSSTGAGITEAEQESGEKDAVTPSGEESLLPDDENGTAAGEGTQGAQPSESPQVSEPDSTVSQPADAPNRGDGQTDSAGWTEDGSKEPAQTDLTNTETATFHPIERQFLAMKAAPIVNGSADNPLQATPSDAEEEPSVATPSDASDPAESPKDGQESQINEEERQYAGSPNGDIYILVTADRITAGGLAAQTAEATLISNCFALVTIGSFVEPVEAYTGGLAGILGAETRTENSYVSGLSDSDGVNGGFAAVNDGAIENCYSTMTIGQSGNRHGAFTVYGNGSLTGCVYDRQMACIPEASPSEAPEQDLTGMWTDEMTGAESRIPGDWRKTEQAYPQLEYFALSGHETIVSSSKVSVVALPLPEGQSLSDVLKAGNIVLPKEVDGQEIQWDGEDGIQIEEGNQIRLEEQVTMMPHDVPVVKSSLDAVDEAPDEDMVMEADDSSKNTGGRSGVRLKASVGEAYRNYALTVAAEAKSYTSWLDVGAEITTPPPVENPGETPGTETNPYLLDSAEDLAWFAYMVNSVKSDICATMTSNIDLFGGTYTDAVYNPNDLSNSLLWKSIKNFAGVFDGGTHIITSLRLSGAGEGSFALFDSVYGATIKNLGVESGYINFKSQRRGSVFIRSLTGGNVINCWNTVDITGGYGEVGGIVAYVLDGDKPAVIDNCYNSGNITGNSQVDCYVGGILGTVWSEMRIKVTIRNCYNTGTITVTSNERAGGILGGVNNNKDAPGLTIENCYNAGKISGTGGMAISGSTSQHVVMNCYYDKDTSVRGDSKATAFTTAQMKSWVAAYKLNEETFDGVWKYNMGAYPTFGSLAPFDWEKAGEALECGFLPADKTKPSGGGTPENPYQIKDAEQLAWFAYRVNSGTQPNACATLMNDINVTGTAYTGTSGASLPWIPIRNYSGTFGARNTDRFEVSGLHIDTTADADANAGLFATATGTISNIAVVDSTLVSSGGSQGAIAGILDGGAIFQCYSRGNEGGGAWYAGGIVGQLMGAGAEIRDCYNLETQLEAAGADSAAGGIAGDGSAGKIQNCYNACLASGFVRAEESAGGTAGSIAGKTGTGNLIQCYSDTDLSDSSQVTMFDTSSDAKRLEQTAGLNTYNGVERKGTDRVWYTSLVDEKTKGYPTFDAPVMLAVAVDPAKVKEVDGNVTGSIGEISGGTPAVIVTVPGNPSGESSGYRACDYSGEQR
ncbi:MAG: GLUG motif-containing protein [Hungatella hathewayi]